ncbi:TonB-dependent receptor [Chitinophaga sp.]|uniref:TonB-dependent receptor domain-containing protein n=1 Tax=Chitinophaga sp. TaxID=1869181 RepID=UPI0031DA91A7
MKTIALLFSIMTLGIASQAQTPGSGKVSGQVVLTGNKPVEFAIVTLLKASDSSLVKGAIADINGKYEIEPVKDGKYLVAAAYVGMTKAYSQPFEVKNSPVKVNALTLSTDTRNLKAVNVTGKKPFVEQRVDKMVVNVENSVVGAGANAMEVLEKSPGITIDKDDNISLKGKNGVVIMIDGKLTNMSSQDVAALLKSMPSSNIEQIELITNPSAKYDAAGNAGIINIKLKKNNTVGTNGSITLGGGYGETPKYNGSLNLNHRNAKYNVFGSYNYNYRRNNQSLDLYRSYPAEGSVNEFNNHNTHNQTSKYNGAKLGFDYFINKNHTIGVMIDGALRDYTMPSHSVTYIGKNGIIDSTLRTDSKNPGDWNRMAYNLNYKGILDTTGKELSIDLDYAHNHDSKRLNTYSNTFDASGKNFTHGDTTRNMQPSTIEIKTFKADYVNPLKHQAKLEAGVKLSFVKSDNDARFDSLRYNNWVYDYNRSNHFIYKENVNAGYVNFSKQFKKLTLQAGLRGELSHIEGNSVTISKVTDTTYFNLFPSLFMSYNVAKDHQLGISYSRRIQRPDYEDLNPFEFYLDRYTKIAGNPYLKPSYSNNFEVTHTFKQFLTTSVAYAHASDKLTQVAESEKDPATGDTSILRYRYLNIAKSDNFTFSISVPFPITKWWNSYTYFQALYAKYETMVDNNLVSVESGGFMGRTQHTFTLPYGITAEATFFYLSSQIADEGLMKMKPMYAFDCGLSKSILHKKGSLKLNVNDVFNNQRFRGTFTNAGRFMSVNSKWESRQVRLAFTYRFGNMNIKAARNHQTGLEDEQNRVKTN